MANRLINGRFDITLRYVEGRGWMPLILDGDGRKVLHGEFKPTADDALKSAQAELPSREKYLTPEHAGECV